MSDSSLTGIWAERGTDDPPLLWSIEYWPAAVPEAKFLTPAQYWQPLTCPTVDIAKMTTFWELKDKGGPLGKINLRVFLLVDSARKAIVVLGIHKKEDEDQLRSSVIERIERRVRFYYEGIARKRS